MEYTHEPSSRRFNVGDTLGIHVFGDMGYNNLSVLLLDGMNVVEMPLCKIDFHGWRYVTAPVVEIEPGVMSYFVVGFKLSRGHEVMGQSGAIRLDNLLKAQSSGIDEMHLAGLKVKCDGDYIVASADSYIQGLELIAVNGQRIAAVGGNCINVSHVTPGVYLVRVHINGATVTQKIILGK